MLLKLRAIRQEAFNRLLNLYNLKFSIVIYFHIDPVICLDSSMVEHAAVNRGVAGSSPARGAFMRRMLLLPLFLNSI